MVSKRVSLLVDQIRLRIITGSCKKFLPTFGLDVVSVVLLDGFVDAVEVDGEEGLFAEHPLLVVVEEGYVAVVDADAEVLAVLGEGEDFLLRVGIVAREENASDHFSFRLGCFFVPFFR